MKLTAPCPYCGKKLTRKEVGRLLGTMGGKMTSSKFSHKHYVKLGKKGMASRWKNKASK